MRSVSEWIGKTDDQKVPDRVRMRVFDREGGICHLTGEKIDPVRDEWDLDHKVALILGGEHRETNLFPAKREPHRRKTAVEMISPEESDPSPARQPNSGGIRIIARTPLLEFQPVRTSIVPSRVRFPSPMETAQRNGLVGATRPETASGYRGDIWRVRRVIPTSEKRTYGEKVPRQGASQKRMAPKGNDGARRKGGRAPEETEPALITHGNQSRSAPLFSSTTRRIGRWPHAAILRLKERAFETAGQGR
ncbi:hypothetical protein ABIA22_002281 [Sinorhizobium fredii]